MLAACTKLEGVTTTQLDPRTLAFDEPSRKAEDTARGQLDSFGGGGWHYFTPEPVLNGNARLSLRAKPSETAAQVTEALPGEALELLWQEGDWVRVRTVQDRYLGWVKQSQIEPELKQRLGDSLSITALRAHAYAGPKVSQPVLAELCFGARVWRGEGEIIEEEQRRWVPVLLPDGTAAYVQEVCFAPLQEPTKEAFALRFLETPYVWGGRSAWGLDCSGLSQLVYAAFGLQIPRDADQQQEFLPSVDTSEPGDLVFFPGHVGIMLDERRLIHANATHMRVTVETLGEGAYGQRLQASCTGFGRAL